MMKTLSIRGFIGKRKRYVYQRNWVLPWRLNHHLMIIDIIKLLWLFFTRSMLCTGPWIFPCTCDTSRTSHQWGLRPGTRKTVWEHNSIEIIYLCWHQTKEIEWSGLEAWCPGMWGGRSWTLGENKQTTLTFISSSSHHLVTTISILGLATATQSLIGNQEFVYSNNNAAFCRALNASTYCIRINSIVIDDKSSQ